MKKQLLIAAVAATMGTAAIADISLTGASKVNYTNVDSTTDTSDTNTFKHDMDFTLKGSNGDTGVVMTFSNSVTSGNSVNDGATAVTAGTDQVYVDVGGSTTTAGVATLVTTTTGLTVEDVYMTSSIGSVNVKIGQYQSTSDSNISDATGSTRKAGRFTADTTIGGVKVTFVDQNASGEALIFSGEVNGVKLSHKIANRGAGANTAASSDYTDTSISGTFGGVTAMYRDKDFDFATANDLSTWQVSTDVNNLHIFAAGAKSDSTSGVFNSEGVFGALSGTNNYTGVGVKTAMAGNTVKVVALSMNDISTGADDDLMKVVITRPLASGATFEATYTDVDYAGATADKTTIDLELAVKF